MNLPRIFYMNSLVTVAGLLFQAGLVVSAEVDAPCPPKISFGTGYIAPASTTEPSWIFRRSTFTNDPETGARVAQYMRKPPVEPLDDPRAVTSRYTRRRTNLRGANGSLDTYYEVQNWGNGRGGLDAEWERFHDAWKDSYLMGGYYNQGPWGYHTGRDHWGPHHGYHQPGYQIPGGGYPGGGWGPGYSVGPVAPGYSFGPGHGPYHPREGQPHDPGRHYRDRSHRTDDQAPHHGNRHFEGHRDQRHNAD